MVELLHSGVDTIIKTSHLAQETSCSTILKFRSTETYWPEAMDIGFYIQRRMKVDIEHIYI